MEARAQDGHDRDRARRGVAAQTDCLELDRVFVAVRELLLEDRRSARGDEALDCSILVMAMTGTPRLFISSAISTGAALRPEFEMTIAASLGPTFSFASKSAAMPLSMSNEP